LAAAQEAKDSTIDAATAPAPSIAIHRRARGTNSGLRALVVARGILHRLSNTPERIGAETQSPMQSVTKSVLSI